MKQGTRVNADCTGLIPIAIVPSGAAIWNFQRKTVATMHAGDHVRPTAFLVQHQ